MKARSEDRLAEHQRQLVDRVLADAEPGTVHVLVAPPGSGKTFALAHTIDALVRGQKAQRVLVLAPAPLVQQWSYLLHECQVETVILDGRLMRRLREQPELRGGWPIGVYVVSIDLAKRPGTSEAVLDQPWDVVVVDDANAPGPQRHDLVRGLALSPSKPVLLLAGDTLVGVDVADRPTLRHELGGVPTAGYSVGAAVGAGGIGLLASLVGGLVARVAGRGGEALGSSILTDWTGIMAASRRRLDEEGAVVSREHRRFHPGEAERAIHTEVATMAGKLAPVDAVELLAAAASSVVALDETLIRLLDENSADDTESLETLLNRVEELTEDAKLDSFKTLLRELVAANVRHVVAFAEHRSTIDYLSSAVGELVLLNHCVLSTDLEADARRDLLAAFQREGGLLITTADASEGVSLSFVEAAIHYDLPLSMNDFARREGRYRRYGRTEPCRVFVIEDASEASPLEAYLSRKLQRLDLVGPEDGERDDASLLRRLGIGDAT